MKLAGIDGVVIDWYGTVDHLDYAVNHQNTAAFVKQAATTGLEFAVCYEDQTIPTLVSAGRLDAGKRVEHARDEIVGSASTGLPCRLSEAQGSAGSALVRTIRTDATRNGRRFWPEDRPSSFT